MPQFFVLAYDGTDAEAPARRRAARAAHLEQIRPMVEKGELRAAGAILDDHGTMVGSALFMEFPKPRRIGRLARSRSLCERGVWQRIEITPFRLAVLDGKITP